MSTAINGKKSTPWWHARGDTHQSADSLEPHTTWNPLYSIGTVRLKAIRSCLLADMHLDFKCLQFT